MVNSYTLLTQIENIEIEEKLFEATLLEEQPEPADEVIGNIMQFASAYNVHSSPLLNEISYLVN
jgi:hypothetical protein